MTLRPAVTSQVHSRPRTSRSDIDLVRCASSQVPGSEPASSVGNNGQRRMPLEHADR